MAIVGDQGKAGEAQSALGKALEQQAGGKPVAEYSASATQALAALNEATIAPQLEPEKRAALYYDQGLCYLLLGDNHQARTCFDHAARLTPLESRYAVMAQHAFFQEHEADLAKVRVNMDKFADDVARDLSNQNAILDRAVGRYIPIQIPPELEQQLARLESMVKNPNEWPASQAALGKYRDELNATAKSVPPWADKETLPRLSALQWAADALETILSSANPQGVDQAKLLDTIEDLLESSGAGVDRVLVERLTAVKGKVAAAVAIEKRKAACDEATTALAGKDIDRLSAAWVGLESFTKGDTDGAIIQLRAVLRTQVINLQSAAQIEALGRDMERVEALPDWRLKMAGLNQILQSCTAQQLSLSLEKGVSGKVTDDLRDLNKRTQARIDAIMAARTLDYQRWVLRCIKDFKAEVAEVRERTKKQASVHGEKWLDADYKQVAAAMDKYLTPVNPGLLDLSVSQLYNRAYETGWKLLEDKSALQEWVAEKATEQPKRGIGDE